MGVIFAFSAQPGTEELSTAEVVMRKLGHLTGYALLTVAWTWALAPRLRRRALPVAALISILYAISDEYHQSFVEGRHATPVDVGIDALGIALAATLILRRVQAGRGREAEQPAPNEPAPDEPASGA
jgi:VanZ family protein